MNYVYIATSLDGYIADKDGAIDWLMETPVPEDDDCGFGAFLSKIDALVMGRNTYEVVLSSGQWPYNKPVFVASNSLKQIDDSLKEKAFLTKGTPKEIVNSLKEQGYNNLYIDGGKTIQSFLKEELIDEMIITIIPQALGEGIPLFEKGADRIKFKTYKTELLSIDAAKMYMKVKD
jgi:dihydrofolate reductase